MTCGLRNIPLPEIQPAPLTVKALSPNHWTTRESHPFTLVLSPGSYRSVVPLGPEGSPLAFKSVCLFKEFLKNLDQSGSSRCLWHPAPGCPGANIQETLSWVGLIIAAMGTLGN